MKIKTRLRLNTWISLAMVMLMMLSLVWSFWEIDKADQNKNLIGEIRKTAFERIVLRDDYLLHREERAGIQWVAKTEALRRLLKTASERFTATEDKALLQEVQKAFDTTVSRFSALLEKDKREGRPADRKFDFGETESRLLGQVFLKAYALQDSIGGLYHSSERMVRKARNKGYFLIFFFVLGGGIAVTINAFLIDNVTTKRLNTLYDGMQIIGGGNLDHRIDTAGDDELADLARNSNHMAASLKGSLTSIDNLNQEIAGRKRVEKEITVLSLRQKAILAGTPNLIMEVDQNKVYTWANLAGLDFFGEDVIGREAADYFEGEQDTYSAVQPLFQGDENTIYVESWQRRKDGQKRLLAWWCRVLKDEKGDVRGALSSAHDITENRRAEEDVAQVAREWQATFDATNDAIWILDRDHRVLRSNSVAESVFRHPIEGFIGKHCWEIVHGTNEPIPECPILRAKHSLKRETMELQVGDAWFEVVVDPIVSADGQYNGAVHIVSNITDRKLAEEQIFRQRKLLTAINKVFYNVLTADSEAEVAMTCLKVAQEITGSQFGFIGKITPKGLYTTTALSDPGWDACRIPGTQAAMTIKDMVIRGIWGQVILKEQSLIVNDPLFCPDRVGIPEGHPPLTSFLGVPLKDQGKVIGMIAMANRESGYTADQQQDMETLCIAFVEAIHRKKAEEAVKKLNIELEQRVIERTAQLEAVNKELEAFSYSVSHDLRAPLRSIDGFSHALLEEYQERPLDKTGKSYLERVCKAAQKMGFLIDDMLKLSLVTQTELNHESFDLSEMVKEILQTAQRNNPDRSVDVVIQEGIMVQGDHDLIQVVMLNLMDNAWKFTGKTEHPRIEFGTTMRDGKTVCFVRDNGAGFDMAYVDKLFSAFQRLHATQEFPGTGIGLATVQRIIHRHRGNIWAEGEIGKGATFHFMLPS